VETPKDESPSETVKSPDLSVRYTRDPHPESAASVAGDGCPKSLPSPTLTSATRGDQARSASGAMPFTLPW
jgi:hypothetical protein